MSIRKRLSKVERLLFPKPQPPVIVVIREGEAGSEAIERTARLFGARPIRPIGVPPLARTNNERAATERRFLHRQTRLYAEMKAISRSQETEQ